jgi:hypothetical protein
MNSKANISLNTVTLQMFLLGFEKIHNFLLDSQYTKKFEIPFVPNWT